MKVNISLKNAQLEAENIQDQHMTSIIAGFFNTLGTQPFGSQVVAKEIASPTKADGVLKSTTIVPVNPLVNQAEKETVNTISKVLPKINGEPTLFTPISEVAKIRSLEQENCEIEVEKEKSNEGIKKYNDGTERYQCKYWCDCGHEGKRWVKETTKHVYCHECNSRIIVELATPNVHESGLPVQDRYGNLYIAREMEVDNL